MNIFNIKMRASRDNIHISGAEQIIGKDDINIALENLFKRAISKIDNIDNSNSIEVNLKINRLDKTPIILKALDSKYIETSTSIEAIEIIKKIFIECGIYNIDKIIDIFINKPQMRGAILLDIYTLEQIQPDRERGIRVSCIDYLNRDSKKKNYFKEAISISTKIANVPGIVGEICVSDDDYPDGCIMTPDKKSFAIRNLKSKYMKGGRIFLYDKKINPNINEVIEFIEKTPVIVDFSNIEDIANQQTIINE